jgi:hypothetical protein
MNESDYGKRQTMLGQRLATIEDQTECLESCLEEFEAKYTKSPTVKLANKIAETRKSLEDLEFERMAIEVEMDNIAYEACD